MTVADGPKTRATDTFSSVLRFQARPQNHDSVRPSSDFMSASELGFGDELGQFLSKRVPRARLGVIDVGGPTVYFPS